MNLKTLFFFCATLLSIYSCSNDDAENIIVEPENTVNGHQYVDLGLKSGTLWATEDLCVNGSFFFSWGETTPKENYAMSTYKYAQGQDCTLTKYCAKDSCGYNGFKDFIVGLLDADDAANINWGDKWHIASWQAWEELYTSCIWKVITVNDTVNFIGKSKTNGQIITFKSIGTMQQDKVLYAKSKVHYWSSTLTSKDDMKADGLSFEATSINRQDDYRWMGHCIRPVIPGERIPSEAVDLGLPSGTKWASTNIGTALPEGEGSFFAWGESYTKPYYDYTYYVHCNGTPKTLIKYCTNPEYGTTDFKTSLEAADDAATTLWGESWRMPTTADINELIDNCTWTLDSINDQLGFYVTGKNGNKIFIPMAGTKYQQSWEYANKRGYYWTSDLDASGDMYGVGLFLSRKGAQIGVQYSRGSGHNIRPVHD